MKRPEIQIRAVLLCLLFFLFYIFLAVNYPVAYWIDAHLRLAQRDHIFIGYWLPTIQVLVYTAAKPADSLLLLRIILSLISATVLFCAYYLANRLFPTSSVAGILALVLLGANLMYTALATVPYPEVLFIGFMFLALICLEDPQNQRLFYLAALSLNLACLTRYEGWLLAGILVSEEVMRYVKSKSLRGFIPMAGRLVLFSFAPLVWVVFVVIEPGGLVGRLDGILNFTTGLTSATLTDRFFTRLNFEYISAFTNNFFHLLNWQLGKGIMVFGLIGMMVALQPSIKRFLHIRILGFLMLDLLLIAFWGPWDFTNLRQTFILNVFLIFYAAYGLEQSIKFIFQATTAVLERSRSSITLQLNSVSFAVIIFVISIYVPSSIEFVDKTSHEVKFFVPAENGSWLNSHLSANDAILVLSDDPFQIHALAAYIPVPLDSILDDRFDDQLQISRLNTTNQTYVVSLYGSKEGLSAGEANLLAHLENGTIPAFSHEVAGRKIWVLPSDSLVDYFSLEKSE